MISVIIPVYNVEEHFERCLDTIINQTYKDLEIILVEDGSTDGSKEICKRYAERDSRISVIYSKNQGPGAARNTGFQRAKGDYIYFMDADDEVEENLLSDNYEIARKKDIDIIIFSYVRVMYKNNKPIGEEKYTYKDIYLQSKDEIKGIFWELYDQKLVFNLWNKLYKREFLMNHQICFTNLRKGQDAVFNLTAFKYVKKIYINNTIYYKYHLYNSNNITSRYTPNILAVYIVLHHTFKELMQEWQLYEEAVAKRINLISFVHITVCVSNLTKVENNKLSIKEKKNELKQIIKSEFNDDIMKDMRLKNIPSMYHKICYMIHKTKNIRLIMMFYNLTIRIKKVV